MQQRRKGHVRRFIALELHVTTAAAPSGQAITHPFRVYVHKGTPDALAAEATHTHCPGLAHDVAGTPDKHLCWYFKTLPEASKVRGIVLQVLSFRLLHLAVHHAI